MYLPLVSGLQWATDEGLLPEIALHGPHYLHVNVFTASKGSNFYILFCSKIECLTKIIDDEEYV